MGGKDKRYFPYSDKIEQKMMQAELGTICFLISAFSRKNQMGADIFTNGEIDGVMLAIGIGILCVSLMAAFFKYRKKGSGGLTDSKHFVYKSLEMPKNGRFKALFLCCDYFVINDENTGVLCGENTTVNYPKIKKGSQRRCAIKSIDFD